MAHYIARMLRARALFLSIAAVLSIAVLAVTGSARAQSFADAFDDGAPSAYWEPTSANPAVAINETNGRLEFSTTANASLNTKKFAGYLAKNWSVRTTSNFFMRVKVHTSASGVGATAGSAQSLSFGMSKVGVAPDANGFPGYSKLWEVGARRVPSGQNSVLYRWVAFTLYSSGSESNIAYPWYAQLSDPSFFYSTFNGAPAFDFTYTETVYMRYSTANDTLYVSSVGYNDPGAYYFANFTNGQRYSVAPVLGGYAIYPGTLSGADAYYDDFAVDSASIDAAPPNVAATDGTLGDKIRVTWSAAPNAVGYKVFRAPAGGTPTLLATLGQAALAYDDTTADRVTEYTYSVQTLTSAGDGFQASDDGWRNIDTPTGVSASDSTYSDRIAVSWTAVDGALGYSVWRAVGTAAPILVGSTDNAGATSFDDTSAAIGTNYLYGVKAISALGATVLSATDTGTRAPYPPADVAASDGTYSQKIRVTWTPITGATSYKVYRRTESGTATLLATVTGGSSAFYDDATTAPLDIYFYSVTSLVGTTESSPSDADLGWRNIAAPVLTCSAGTSADAVEISWPAVSGATGYTIFRTAPSGTPVEIVNGLGSTTYSDTGADPLVLYTYTAQAEHSFGESPTSTAVNGWRNAQPPAGVSATDGDFSNKVVVSWSAVSGASGYSVWRKVATATTAATQIGTVSGGATLSYNDTTAAVGTSYLYSVKANHALGSTALSATDSGWRSTSAPATVTATKGAYTDKVRVTWTAAASATGYKVFRRLGSDDPVQIGSTTGASGAALGFDDTTALAATGYSYSVRTVTAAGDSPMSGSDTGWRNLPAPTGVAASDGTYTDKVRVTWTPVAGASAYRVFRKLGTAAPVEVAFVLGESSAQVDDSSAAVAKSYLYSVKTVCGLGDSASSLSDAGIRAPAAPAGVTATDGLSTANVRVTWSLSSGATGYQVYRRTEGGSAVLIKSLGSTIAAYDDTTAVALTTYLYSVVATGSGVSSPTSGEDSGWRNIAAPTASAALGTSSTGVGVSWTSVSAATGYRVLRAVSGGNPVQIAEVGTVTSYVDESAASLVTYQYRVQAIHGLGSTASSNAATGWLNVDGPATASATDGSFSNKVTITWDPVPGATGYVVYRKLPSIAIAPTAVGNITSGATLSFDDTTAATATRYSYFVRSKHALGTSLASPTDDGWRNTTAPATIAATDGTYTDKIRVTWSASASATGYKVYRQAGSDTAELVGTLTSPTPRTFDDTGCDPGVVYSYRVSAVTALGESAQSAANTGWRKVVAPTAVAASDGSYTDRVTISWSAPVGATGFKVFRKIGASTVEIASIADAGTTSFDDTTIAVATLATYTVQPQSAAGVGVTSAGDTGWRNRPAPTGVAASDGTFPDKVVVSWQAVTGATSYRVFRSIDAGASTQIGTTAASVLTFSDFTIPVGQTGSYTVVAVQALGVTAPSDADTGYRASGFAGAGSFGGGGSTGPVVIAVPGGSGSKPSDGASSSEEEGAGGATDEPTHEQTVPAAIPVCSEVLARIAALAALETDTAVADALTALAEGETPSACAMLAGDVNLDGTVDGADIVALLAAVAADDLLIADIDRDGAITVQDLAIVTMRVAEAAAS